MPWWGVLIVAVFAMAPASGFAQDRVVHGGGGPTIYPAPPRELEPAPLDDIAAGVGNLARWRDAERARVGAYSRENAASNAARLREYENALQQRRRLPPDVAPERLPVGEMLPTIGGYFWLVFQENGQPSGALVAGRWDDPGSNAGDPSRMLVSTVHADRYCGVQDVSIADLAYLGTTLTAALRALDEPKLPPAGHRMLDRSEMTIERAPSASEFGRYYPPRAFRSELAGGAGLRCVLAASGPAACTIESESSEGWGFGEAALRVAASYVFGATLKDGTPAQGRTVCLKVHFRFAE